MRDYANNSKLIGVPRAIASRARRPMISGKYFGVRPNPGLIDRTFLAVIFSPADIFSTA
jgi:hypothetical protein